jgi:hypothetical protein
VARHIHTAQRRRQLRELLTRDHTLSGGILLGLDGYVIEVQARAMEVLPRPTPWPAATDISGMAGAAVREVTIRIAGALAKLRIPEPEVSIQISLTPASVLKEGAWLDLPLAIIMLQASEDMPDMPRHEKGNDVLVWRVDQAPRNTRRGTRRQEASGIRRQSLGYLPVAGFALLLASTYGTSCPLATGFGLR